MSTVIAAVDNLLFRYIIYKYKQNGKIQVFYVLFVCDYCIEFSSSFDVFNVLCIHGRMPVKHMTLNSFPHSSCFSLLGREARFDTSAYLGVLVTLPCIPCWPHCTLGVTGNSIKNRVDLWEPFYIGPNNVPFYDERFQKVLSNI